MVEPVILELAVNGATPRHRNRHVPRAPAEITAAALAGIEAGASIGEPIAACTAAPPATCAPEQLEQSVHQ